MNAFINIILSLLPIALNIFIIYLLYKYVYCRFVDLPRRVERIEQIICKDD
jgi:hypothetical protein